MVKIQYKTKYVSSSEFKKSLNINVFNTNMFKHKYYNEISKVQES